MQSPTSCVRVIYTRLVRRNNSGTSTCRESGLLDETSLKSLDRHPDAFRAAIGHADPNPLQVRAELAFRDTGHVRADAATLLGLALAVYDAPFDGTTTCDYADFGHGGMS
jgi:hypothetical protein